MKSELHFVTVLYIITVTASCHHACYQLLIKHQITGCGETSGAGTTFTAIQNTHTAITNTWCPIRQGNLESETSTNENKTFYVNTRNYHFDSCLVITNNWKNTLINNPIQRVVNGLTVQRPIAYSPVTNSTLHKTKAAARVDASIRDK